MAYQSPKKNLQISVEYKEELNQQKEEDDKKFDYDIHDLNGLEEEDGVNTSQKAIVRHILSILKDGEDWRCTPIFHCGNQT